MYSSVHSILEELETVIDLWMDEWLNWMDKWTIKTNLVPLTNNFRHFSTGSIAERLYLVSEEREDVMSWWRTCNKDSDNGGGDSWWLLWVNEISDSKNCSTELHSFLLRNKTLKLILVQLLFCFAAVFVCSCQKYHMKFALLLKHNINEPLLPTNQIAPVTCLQ